MSIKLMLVDDHILIREGIKQLLRSDSDITFVGEASNGIECMDKLSHIKPDIILLDVNMPLMNGLQVLKQIRKKKINVLVIILTTHSDTNYILEAVDNKVNGYLLKDTESNELKKAIRKVYEGEVYIQPSLMPILNSSLVKRDIDKDKLELLTKREVEILKLIVEGLFNKEIAIALTISERTVKNHVSNIFKKIEVNDRTQAAVFAIKNNMVNIF